MKNLEYSVPRTVWEDFWAHKKEVKDVYPTSDRIVQNLKKTGDVHGKWILEVGAGTGRDSFRLVDEGANLVVLDYAENSLNIVQQLGKQTGKKVHPIQADAFYLPLKTSSIDIVFHQGLLEHFKEPMPLLLENYRVARPGGYVLVDVPQRYHLYTVIKHILIRFNAWFAGWETEFSITELTKLMQNAGFRIFRSYGDWMRPSLFYRIFREILIKIKITLPLFPKGIPGLRQARALIRERFRKTRVSYYTYLDIGVIGLKDEPAVE